MMRALRMVQLALDGLRRTPLRVVLTTLGVAIASAALVTMVSFAVGVQEQAETPFRLLDLLKNIQVSPRRVEGQPPAVLDDQTLRRFEEIPGVAVAYPDIRIKGLKLRRGEKNTTGIAVAMPREAALFGVAEDILVAGRFFSEHPEAEVILGRELARELGFDSPEDALDQQVDVETAGFAPGKLSLERRELAVTIVGVYEMPVMMPGPARRGVLLPMELMKQIPRMPDDALLDWLRSGKNAKAGGYASATVRVRAPGDLTPVEQELQTLGFKTQTILTRFEQMQVFFLFLDVLLAAIGTVALLVAALGIVNTLLMSVLERYQEIGIYKALGASDGDLFLLFLTEAGIIGILGGLGGILLGRGVSWVLEIAVNLYAQGRGAPAHVGLFAFPWWLLAATLLFSLAVSILAGVYPAMRAARVDPIRVLRGE